MAKVGLMNNPRRDPLDEVRWMGENGFDFVDFTVELPRAARPDPVAIREELLRHRMEVVGHTDPNLPYAYPSKEVMAACRQEFARCAQLLSLMGAKRINIHPCYSSPPCMKSHRVSHNIKALKELDRVARDLGLELMIENFLHPFDSVETFEQVFDQVPTLRLHLDVGHAAIQQPVNRTKSFLEAFRDRLVHMHLSDNRYRSDDHMPLGAGEISWRDVLVEIRRSGYDGTFTLEVFSNEREYQLLSRAKFTAWWQAG